MLEKIIKALSFSALFIGPLIGSAKANSKKINNEKQKCNVMVLGWDTRMIGVSGLKEYAKSSPEGGSEIDDALEGIKRLPFPMLSSEFRHCFGKEEKLLVGTKVNFVSTKPIQYFMDGEENFVVDNWNLRSYLGVGWGAEAAYSNYSIGVGYKLHPFASWINYVGYSQLNATAYLELDDLDIKEKYSGLKTDVSRASDLELIELRERGHGYTIESMVVIRNMNHMEVGAGFVFQRMYMSRDLYVPSETEKELDAVYDDVKTVENESGYSVGVKEQQTSWAKKDVINMSGVVVGARWWF